MRATKRASPATPPTTIPAIAPEDRPLFFLLVFPVDPAELGTDDDEVAVAVPEPVLVAVVAVKNAVELTEIFGKSTLTHLVDACDLEQQVSVGLSLQYWHSPIVA
jgi:hypothetical protein